MIPGIVAGGTVVGGVLTGIDALMAEGPVYIAHRGAALRYPEATSVAYAESFAAGLVAVEQDCVINASGSLVCSHDLTTDYVTTTSGSYSAISDAGVAGLTVDSSSWFGVAYSPISIMLFRDVLSAYKSQFVFFPEVKSGGGSQMAAELSAASVSANSAVVSSFSVADLASPKGAGYRTMLTSAGADILSAATAAGVDYVCYEKTSSSTRFTDAITAGVPVFAYTVDRRMDRDSMLALGVSGMYSNDPEYLLSDSPASATDSFSSQEWAAGMIASGAANDSRPSLAERGRFFSPDYWGFSESNDSKRFVLQGWACPIKGDIAADDYTIDLKITFDENSGGGTSRWAALFIADSTRGDDPFLDEVTGRKGYGFLFRKNGNLDIYRKDDGGTSLLNSVSGSSISTGQEVRFNVTVSPSTIVSKRLDAGGGVVQTNSVSDTTYRGGYFHLGRYGLACKFRDISIS